MPSEYRKYFNLPPVKERTFGFEEMMQACNAETKHVLSHAKHWDVKWDSENKIYLSYRHSSYDVDLPKDRDDLGGWAVHLANKVWIEPESIYEFIHLALCLLRD
jgi:hypothetical protein